MMSTPPSTIPTDSSPSELPAHRLRRMQEPPRTVILGGGPLGLEAALYASRLGHAVWLF
jgi:NADPH-dependent 2,4-dienoyl-CoA reductase/sulfur reductase-like enzyme